MPVFSYLAYPEPGAKDELLNDLATMDHCEATPAENEEVLILLTDAPDDESDKALRDKLKDLKSLQSLAMTFGHTDE